MEYITKLIPPDIGYVIQKVDIGQRDKVDQAIWMDNPSGKFTCASAFQVLRKRQPESPIWRCIWNKINPFKMAFISWRIIKKKMPMYDRIKNFSNESDPMCICCNDPKEESMLHVFIEGELAKKVWEFFGDSLGIKIQNQTIQARYGNKKYYEAKIYYEVAQHVKGIMNKKGYLRDNWSRICSSMEAHKAVLTSFPVVWSKPLVNTIKINTDGSNMVLCNKAGIGGIARNSRGDIIMAFAKAVQFCSINSAEIQAASFGINWLNHNDINNGIIEVDSILVVKWLDGEYSIPWEFLKEIEALKRIIDKRRIKVQHCFRKANTVADSLAKFGSNTQFSFIANLYYTMQEIPRQARGAVRMDKAQLANFRIRTRRRT
ncbi:uncharacterized protein LOC132631065 [Lycium barbarum]|uniref:uncharacterized protein LOC132631065 n=1 Tax=Lycium barbarum TaxID=112863 RepID=UPI00293E3AE1|nr:uncharacterized protein LOC132631065 [Lycium barbarum]